MRANGESAPESGRSMLQEETELNRPAAEGRSDRSADDCGIERPAADPGEDIDLRPDGGQLRPFPSYILIINEHGDGRAGYGIGRLEDGEVRGAITDITSDESLVRETLAKINRYGLDPVHLRDIVEDMLKQ